MDGFRKVVHGMTQMLNPTSTITKPSLQPLLNRYNFYQRFTEDRFDSLELLMESIQKHFMALRNTSRITEEIVECLFDIATFTFEEEPTKITEEDVKDYRSLSSRCEMMDSLLGQIRLQLEEVLSTQIIERKAISSYLAQWLDELVILDKHPDVEHFDDINVFMSELEWYYRQSDNEIASVLQSIKP